MDFQIYYQHVRPTDNRELVYFIMLANEATHKGKKLKLPFSQKTLRYDSNGLYSYETKIADINFALRTIKRLGTFSTTSSRHYNRTLKHLMETYDFSETF